MPVIKDEAIIEDSWVLLGEEDLVPDQADIILPLSRYLELRDSLNDHNGKIGISIDNYVEIESVADHITDSELILLHLPSFTDGRAYSQARFLIETLEFKGELRLKGDILVDQAAFLLRCGFDSFDTDKDIDLSIWKNSIELMSHSYQRGYEDSLLKRTS